MPVPAMVEPVVDHQKRFQAAVDVIHKLPKNGSYRPSYEVMRRFYSLYKQAVCGPCTVPRPGFWDPVGRYKWDAWNQLGEMSSESAMAAYVDEMKKVAQEIIDTMPMDEKTASLFHYFEPLYLVIGDMPRPPTSLLTIREGLKGGDHADSLTKLKDTDEEKGEPKENTSPEVVQPSAYNIHNADSALSEGMPLTSDSESEIFCDSVDSLEQLSNIETKSSGVPDSHVSLETAPVQSQKEGRKVGAGQGGEGVEDGKDPIRRSRHTGRTYNWRERGPPQGSSGRSPGGGSGDGRGGGDGSEGGAERLHEAHLQQQIILALRRLREDMRSVMDRLEVVERLAATHAHGSELRPCPQCEATALLQEEQKWWPFDVSGQTVLLFLLWPFVAHFLVYLLRKRSRMSK